MSAGRAIEAFEQFATSRGLGAASRPTASHIRSTKSMSGIALRRAQEQHRGALSRWQAGRDAARIEYAQLVEAGKIVLPSRLQRLRRAARGHPDLPSVQIAQQLLRKSNVTW